MKIGRRNFLRNTAATGGCFACVSRLAVVGALLPLGAPRPAFASTEPEIEALKVAIAAAQSTVMMAVGWVIGLYFEAEMATALALEMQRCDPASCRIVPNYTSAVVPRNPVDLPRVTAEMLALRFSGNIDDQTIRLFQSALQDEFLIAAHEAAVFETSLRRYTAEQRKNREAETLQALRWTELVRATSNQKRRANMTWTSLLSHLQEREIKEKAWKPDYAAFKMLLRKSGFPVKEAEIMRAFGLSEREIEFARNTIVRNLDPRRQPQTFVDLVHMYIALNSYNKDIEACSCADATARTAR